MKVFEVFESTSSRDCSYDKTWYVALQFGTMMQSFVLARDHYCLQSFLNAYLHLRDNFFSDLFFTFILYAIFTVTMQRYFHSFFRKAEIPN